MGLGWDPFCLFVFSSWKCLIPSAECQVPSAELNVRVGSRYKTISLKIRALRARGVLVFAKMLMLIVAGRWTIAIAIRIRLDWSKIGIGIKGWR